MSRLLPVRVPLASPLVRRVRDRLEGGAVEQLLSAARAMGTRPVALYPGPRSPGLRAPSFVLVHEPAPPDPRAQLSTSRSDLLALSTREWEVWSSGPVGRLLRGVEPLWGAALPTLDEDEVEARRHRLRLAAELYWRHPEDAPGALRALCTRETLPSRFPPIPASADPEARYAADFGVMHATFAGEVAPDEGPRLEPEDRLEPTFGDALRALTRPLLADLPRHARGELLSLALFPGPFGAHHAWQLVAVVADDAPLHRAAALRRRLSAHLGLLPRDLLAGACVPGSAPVVVTRATLQGQLRRRLWLRPLRRLSIRLSGLHLLGEDTVFDGLQGTDFTGLDLRAEVAALLSETGRLLGGGGTAAEARDLLFGCWPRALSLARGGSALEPLAALHAELASRSDKALARVGSAAPSQPWGDPALADRGRVGLLREWAPALIRLQEVTLEALG